MRDEKNYGSKKIKRILPLVLSLVLTSSLSIGVKAEAIPDIVTSDSTSEVSVSDEVNETVYTGESSQATDFDSTSEITDADEFPEGMTEEEKQQLVNEIYEDINADESYDPNDENRLKPEDIENGAVESELESLSDEEIEQLIRKTMPSDTELDDMAENLGNQVLNLAKYHCGYDKARNMYRYYYSSGDGFTISVPIGGWSNYAVAIKTDKNIQLMNILRDGVVLDYAPGDDGVYLFREYGKYEFQIGGMDNGRTAMIQGTFRIVSPTEKVNESFIWTPEGYNLNSVICDGSTVRAMDKRYVSLATDGSYEISYTPVAEIRNILPDYSIYFVRDTTPPVIHFDGEIERGHFAGEVTYSVTESDADVAIYYNGQQAVSENHVLAAAGDYYITATDSSGNRRSYSFIILRRGHIPWPLVGVVFGAFILMSMFVILTSKKYMRIK